MLFAAGFGTRMRKLTADRPKPLVDVAGRALIDFALDQIRDFGASTVVANLHYLPDQIIAHLDGQDVLFSHEKPDILDTGGGLRHARTLLGPGPVFTMNSDAVWNGPNPLLQLAEVWDPDLMDALLLCIPPQQAIGHTGKGDFLIDINGRIARGPGLIYSGLQILKTDDLDSIDAKCFSLNVLWDRMLTQDRLFGLTYDGLWCDVGTPKGIEKAEAMLREADV